MTMGFQKRYNGLRQPGFDSLHREYTEPTAVLATLKKR